MPLWPTVGLPLLGFLVLAASGRRLGERAVGGIGVGSVALAFLATVAAVARAGSGVVTETYWTWFEVGGLAARFELALDPLSACFALVITGVGALIHLHATDYMRGDPGFARFFATMNLFVASMLVLVLANDLLLLYLGWEGVGLCSYLLIGFWYEDPANGRAARKAFVVTRVGDAALAVALFLLATTFGTLRLPELAIQAPAAWTVGEPVAVLTACLLAVGAFGKSAQLPLQVWLPDAMAGPTPVSALIHAATMVTAGVYLVARTHPLFLLAPTALEAVAVVGLMTMLVAGLCALAQQDAKRVLAYSTISQVGLMFLALGVGAWSAAVFHFVTHALFKALLFLGLGSVLVSVHHERDLRELGGLRHRLPVVFVACTVGALASAGFPLLTAGFFSKDEILLAAARTSWVLWALATAGAVITSLYTFRFLLLLFFGPVRTEPHRAPSRAAEGVLMALAVGTVAATGLMLPRFLGGLRPLERWLGAALPTGHAAEAPFGEGLGALASAAASLLGLGLSVWIWGSRPGWWAKLGDSPLADRASRFLRDGFGFDALYEALLVGPFTELGRLNKGDVVDSVAEGTASFTRILHDALAITQNGRLRWYMAATAAGAVTLLGIALWGSR